MKRCDCGRTLTKKNTFVTLSRQERCVACFAPAPPVPSPRDPSELRSLLAPSRRGKVPAYMLTGAPPAEVLEQALCTPETEDLLPRLCYSCPVRELCLEWALVNNQRGFYGGRDLTTTRAFNREVRRRAALGRKESA